MQKASVRMIVSGVAVALVVAAVPLFATHSWNGYHWARTANPFTLQLGDNMTTAQWKTLLQTTSGDWNASNVLDTRIVLGASGTKRCKMVAGTTQVCNGTYGYNGWLGLATINVTPDKHITQGSAKMNDSYFNLARYNNSAEKLHVVCQEVAHTFGLAHQSESGASLNTCMDYYQNTSDSDTKSTKPNQHDFDELNEIYSHLDSMTTLASSTAASAGADVDDNDPNSWGQLVSQSRNGRSSTYERANRDASFTITHVFWTLEAAENCPSCDHRFDR
jgi:hypothetical protein